VWGVSEYILQEFVLKRQCNASNVFLLRTSDPKRISQFINFVKTFDIFQRHRKLFYSVQTSEFLNLESNTPVSFASPETAFQMPGMVSFTPQQVLGQLREKPTLLIISYISEQRHANMVSDLLIAAAHDDACYRQKSTVAVFTADENLFNNVVRRFCYTIELDSVSPEERKALLERIKRELEQELQKELNLTINADVINAASGLTLHDTETAALESFVRFQDFKVEVFTEYKIKLLREMGLEYIEPKRGFESVGGYEYLKDYVKNRIVKVLRNPDLAEKFGIPIPKGILLYGMPGTGKTWFAKALAKEVGLPMVILDPSTFLRGVVGETEARVKQITALIESLAPIICFIDEFDQLTMSRQAVVSTDSGVSRRLTNMLLAWLGDENRKAFIVGATNYVRDVDPAFLRPGRLDEVIPVLYPDQRARRQILEVHTRIIRKVPLAKNVDLDEIARKTVFFTGAELEKLVIEAASLAMSSGAKTVSMKHFEKALESVEINIAERKRTLDRTIRELQSLENVNKLFLKKALEACSLEEFGVSTARVKGVVKK